jgi:hypothetical protein
MYTRRTLPATRRSPCCPSLSDRSYPMSKAPKKVELMFSAIQYRPTLSDTGAKPISLGVLLEFAVNDIWVVGLAMRHAVDKAATEALDPLSRELIDARMEIIKGEVDDALNAARRPGDVLRILSDRNGWSFSVARPQPLSIPTRESATVPTIEKLAEQYVLMEYRRALLPTSLILPARATKGARRAAAQGQPVHTVPETPPEVPLPWMLPTVYWRAPLGGHG